MWAYVIPIAGLVLAGVGVLVAVTPAQTLLRFDRKTGHFLYRTAPDHETGLRRAAVFYRLFGVGFALFALAWSALVTYLAASSD
ncbi:MAG: hypothetical protein KF729_00640 [Sandaracinaceae bacterium]|nr:hypothetical protein [Sandaracinaceae bacterium]